MSSERATEPRLTYWCHNRQNNFIRESLLRRWTRKLFGNSSMVIGIRAPLPRAFPTLRSCMKLRVSLVLLSCLLSLVIGLMLARGGRGLRDLVAALPPRYRPFARYAEGGTLAGRPRHFYARASELGADVMVQRPTATTSGR